jgi:hypothetical protein
MRTVVKLWRRSLTAFLAALVAAAVGLTGLAEPAASAYAPTVALSAYTVTRGQSDHAKIAHFLANHAGTVYIVQGGNTIVLKSFHTGSLGGATFYFKILLQIQVGYHYVHFRTGGVQKSVRIRVTGPPTVALSQYRVHRRHLDHARLTRFLADHPGTVYTFQGGSKIVLKRFETGSRGGASFYFRIVRALHVGYHYLHFRTGGVQKTVRIRVLR